MSKDILPKTVKTFKYFHIDLIQRKPKTNIYHVFTNKKVPCQSGVILERYECLGQILWSSSWRQYIFNTEWNIDFSRDCLQDIITFIQKLMDGRKVKKDD